MAVKKVKLAEVLWEAANEHLDPGSELSRGTLFSCHAIYNAADPNWRKNREIDCFCRALGCDPDDAHFDAFNDGPQRQGIRYMWLLLAMHVAEDEGIEIEVER